MESNEIAALRAENASLRVSLAELQLEVESLRKQLNNNHGNGKPRLPKAEQDTEPVFPIEIFLGIAQFLKPQSQSFVRLMSTCKSLYAALIPRLLERLDTDIILNPFFAHYRLKSLPLLASHVKEIKLFSDHRTGFPGIPPLIFDAQRVLATCAEKLQRLSIEMDGSDDEEKFPSRVSLDRPEMREPSSSLRQHWEEILGSGSKTSRFYSTWRLLCIALRMTPCDRSLRRPTFSFRHCMSSGANLYY